MTQPRFQTLDTDRYTHGQIPVFNETTQNFDAFNAGDTIPATVLRNGTGAPDNSLGHDGDYYLDTATGDIYHREGGVYVLHGNLHGEDGQGVPEGGATGQALVKASGVDYDTSWVAKVAAAVAADTLGGHDGAYYLGRGQHTGTQAISTVAGLGDALSAETTARMAVDAGLQSAVDGKAPLSHSHVAANVTDFTEAVEDVIGSFFVAGTGVSLNYNDAANTFTITNTDPLSTEQVQDIVGVMVAAGTGVSASYDDAAGTLTIASTSGSALTTEDVQDIVAALLQQGTNVTLTYNDAANTLTVTAAGGTDGSQSANTVKAGPTSGSASTPAYRALVAADIPSLDAAKIATGTFPIARLASGTPDGTKFVADDGTLKVPAGGGGTATFTGAVVKRTSNYSTSPNTTQIIPWTTEQWDTNNYHDNTTNNTRITIPTGGSGKYRIYASINWDYTVSTVGRRGSYLLKNGIEITRSVVAATSGEVTSNLIYYLDDAIAGDYYEIDAEQNAGTSAVLIIASSSRFGVEKIG